MFITFEGGEGSGKTTQSKRLYKYLQERGMRVVHTREPGGTKVAEEIRNILVNGTVNKMHRDTELLLYIAARVEHYKRKICPLLQNGFIVICDRFHDSTLAYQCAKGVSQAAIDSLYSLFLGDIRIDRTYLLSVNPNNGIYRATRKRKDENRFEQMGIKFHTNVLRNFKRICKANSDRILCIDSTGNPKRVFETIVNDFNALLDKQEKLIPTDNTQLVNDA